MSVQEAMTRLVGVAAFTLAVASVKLRPAQPYNVLCEPGSNFALAKAFDHLLSVTLMGACWQSSQPLADLGMT